jgi:hypothetical protein
MRTSTLIALAVIVLIVLWVTGGGALFRALC